MKGRLRLDDAGLFASRVGRAGLRRAAFARALARARSVLTRIARERREGRHAFLDLPADRATRRDVSRYARAARGRGIDTVVVLGIGGSALGTSAVAAALRPPFAGAAPGAPRLAVLDNIDPDWLSSFLAGADLARAQICVVSKSGGTPETVAQFIWMRDLLRRRLGARHKERLVIVTDPEKGPLRRIAREEGYAAFPVPPNVGGRFSVLSAACLVPLSLVGVDIERLARGAAEMARACRRPDARNPALRLAAALSAFHGRGVRNVVLMPYANALWGLADWYRQLLAESVGKRLDLSGRPVHVGLTPIPALGATDQHSQVQLYVEGPFDKVVLFVAVDAFRRRLAIPRTRIDAFSYLSGRSFNALLDAERRGTTQALIEAGRPSGTLHLPRIAPETVGQFLFLMELKVAVLGYLLGVNPYDQPGVERGKILARDILARGR